MEGGTASFMRPYVSSQSREAMITMARLGPLGRGGNNEPAEAGPHTPDPRLHIERSKKKENCSECNRGTRLEWTWNDVIKFRLCQSCAKRRGGSYLSAIRDFTI